MMNKRSLNIALVSLALFVLWTLLVCTLDVQAVGPAGSSVGLARLNCYVHSVTGVHMLLYHITDWLGLVPIAFMLGFALYGLIQWFKRKRLFAVDPDILLLGGFYVVVFVNYFLFEYIVINYRPILINGYLEASYPSSTTLLVLCVMPTARVLLQQKIQNSIGKKIANTSIILFCTLMVIGRLLSGVHWFTDIIGGVLLSNGLVMLYRAILSVQSVE